MFLPDIGVLCNVLISQRNMLLPEHDDDDDDLTRLPPNLGRLTFLLWFFTALATLPLCAHSHHAQSWINSSPFRSCTTTSTSDELEQSLTRARNSYGVSESL